MATRATTLSPAHVEAINGVPIEFYRVKAVMDQWEEYYAHLCKDPSTEPWVSKKTDLLNALLITMGKKLGYKFNNAETQRIYFPEAHNNIFLEQDTIRRQTAALLRGDFPLQITLVRPDNEIQAERLRKDAAS